MNKKKGFTLVELLAVIVILAVILVIAVPQIISTITESRKGVLASSAKLIASSAESMKISNQALGIDSEITCEDVAQLTSEDYDTCKIDFIDGDAYVSIIGKGKFEGMAVLSGTVEKAEAIRTTGLELTSDGNIRYTGKNPSNYVEFGNDGELWRIIGIFNLKTAEGKTEKLMKIVRNESIGRYSWDSSDSSVNNGGGVNQWGESTYENGSAYAGADLMVRLNDSYLNRTGDYGDTKTIKGINSTSRSMIETVVWNIGAFYWGKTPAKTAYEEERRTTTGQECKGTTYQNGAYCTDTVKRTTTWEGRVGLIYPSDYGYASTNTSCRNNINDLTNYSCKNDNWLHIGSGYWTLSPFADTGRSHSAWLVFSSGCVYYYSTRDEYGVRPSVYLKSNISIISGEGTEQSPYKLSGN